MNDPRHLQPVREPSTPGLTDEVLAAVNKGRAMRGQPPLEGRGPSFYATDEELASLDVPTGDRSAVAPLPPWLDAGA